MNVQLTETSATKYGVYFEGSCEKVSAFVFIYPHSIQVGCMNASHRAWGGMGKNFPNATAAMNGYKSGEMKAIIAAAVAANTVKVASA